MIHGINPERLVTAGEAISRMLNLVESLGFKYTVSEFGNLHKTVFFKLEDGAGRQASGIGKGFQKHSMASAIAEAIEHYFYKYDTSPIYFNPLNPRRPDDWQDGCSPDFSEILQETVVTLGSYEYRHNITGEVIKFPVFLGNPNYESSSAEERNDLSKFALFRYSCNSGTACGIGNFEAELHGLLELIERDSIAILLLETVIAETPNSVKKMHTDTIPIHLFEFIKLCEKEYGAKFEIFDMTSDLRIPSYLTAVELPNGARFFGSGASLFSDYALERSITEAIQCVHSQEFNTLQLPVGPTESLIKHLPKFSRCFMDKGIFSPRGKTVMISYNVRNLINIDAFDDDRIKCQFEFIVNHLALNGIDTYSRSIWSDLERSGVRIHQVIAPKLERFYLVASGLHVLPNQRGRLRLELYST